MKIITEQNKEKTIRNIFIDNDEYIYISSKASNLNLIKAAGGVWCPIYRAYRFSLKQLFDFNYTQIMKLAGDFDDIGIIEGEKNTATLIASKRKGYY